MIHLSQKNNPKIGRCGWSGMAIELSDDIKLVTCRRCLKLLEISHMEEDVIDKNKLEAEKIRLTYSI